MRNDLLCPCHSHRSYNDCCKKYHEGTLPETALELMRSRYSAYALHLVDYIIATTHSDNPAYSSDIDGWKDKILAFSQNTRFEDLKILKFVDGEKIAYVTFTAYLKQSDQDATFTEESQFVKVDGRWLYKLGLK